MGAHLGKELQDVNLRQELDETKQTLAKVVRLLEERNVSGALEETGSRDISELERELHIVTRERDAFKAKWEARSPRDYATNHVDSLIDPPVQRIKVKKSRRGSAEMHSSPPELSSLENLLRTQKQPLFSCLTSTNAQLYSLTPKAGFRLLRANDQECVYEARTNSIQTQVLSQNLVKLVWVEQPRNVLLIKKPRDPDVTRAFVEVARFLKREYRMNLVVEPAVMDEETSRGLPLITWRSREELTCISQCLDLVVCLGGDGTLLWLSSLFQGPVPPVISFALGSLGFLTPFSIDNMEKAFKAVMVECNLTLRSRLICRIRRGGQPEHRSLGELSNASSPPSSPASALGPPRGHPSPSPPLPSSFVSSPSPSLLTSVPAHAPPPQRPPVTASKPSGEHKEEHSNGFLPNVAPSMGFCKVRSESQKMAPLQLPLLRSITVPDDFAPSRSNPITHSDGPGASNQPPSIFPPLPALSFASPSDSHVSTLPAVREVDDKPGSSPRPSASGPSPRPALPVLPARVPVLVGTSPGLHEQLEQLRARVQPIQTHPTLAEAQRPTVEVLPSPVQELPCPPSMLETPTAADSVSGDADGQSPVSRDNSRTQVIAEPAIIAVHQFNESSSMPASSRSNPASSTQSGSSGDATSVQITAPSKNSSGSVTDPESDEEEDPAASITRGSSFGNFAKVDPSAPVHPHQPNLADNSAAALNPAAPAPPPQDAFFCLNEVIIDRGPESALTNLDCYCDDLYFTKVQADGIIIATPTGSTAYSLSAGGSMVHPEVPAVCFTPICPHSLSFRPVLFPDSTTLKIVVSKEARGDAGVSFDGHHRQILRRGDSVEIKVSRYPIPAICAHDETDDWFAAVRGVLQWNVRAKQKSLPKSRKSDR